jgi:cysteinyl-tRNA synthetase
MAHAYLEAPAQGAVQEAFLNECYSALANDLDTPKVLALVWQHISTLNKPTLQQVNTMLGLDFTEESPLYTLTVKAELPDNVQELVRNREEARNAKDFALSDSLRTDIETAGYEVTDTREGPVTTKR